MIARRLGARKGPGAGKVLAELGHFPTQTRPLIFSLVADLEQLPR